MNNKKYKERLMAECVGCMHPQSVGYCEYYCGIKQASNLIDTYDAAFNRLEQLYDKYNHNGRDDDTTRGIVHGLKLAILNIQNTMQEAGFDS